MCENFVPVLEFYGERRAREDLFDRPENFNRALFIGLLRRLLGRFDPAGSLIRTAGSYDFTCFNCMILVYRTRQGSAKPFGPYIRWRLKNGWANGFTNQGMVPRIVPSSCSFGLVSTATSGDRWKSARKSVVSGKKSAI